MSSSQQTQCMGRYCTFSGKYRPANEKTVTNMVNFLANITTKFINQITSTAYQITRMTIDMNDQNMIDVADKIKELNITKINQPYLLTCQNCNYETIIDHDSTLKLFQQITAPTCPNCNNLNFKIINMCYEIPIITDHSSPFSQELSIPIIYKNTVYYEIEFLDFSQIVDFSEFITI